MALSPLTEGRDQPPSGVPVRLAAVVAIAIRPNVQTPDAGCSSEPRAASYATGDLQASYCSEVNRFNSR
jgi:hypothetical protein